MTSGCWEAGAATIPVQDAWCRTAATRRSGVTARRDEQLMVTDGKDSSRSYITENERWCESTLSPQLLIKAERRTRAVSPSAHARRLNVVAGKAFF